jgi:outer membrane protein assembly factor BamB
MPAMLWGRDSGYVLSWSPGQGFRKVKGTDAPFPNGIEVSDDGQTVYLNAYFGNEVRKIDRRTGQLLGSAPVTRPDNSTWGADGRLLVASHVGPLREMMACNSLERGACPLRFQVVALDPETMAAEIVLEHAGPPLGAATVALVVGDALYLGSFAGDRIARAPLAPGVTR